MISIGLCSMTFQSRSPEEVVKICKQHDLDIIEWAGRDNHIPPDISPARLNEILMLCDDEGINMPTFGSYFDAYNQDPGDFNRVLDIATALGSKVVRIWSGDWDEPGELSRMSEDKINILVERSRVLATMARERNIKLAYEYHEYMPTCGADEFNEIFRRAGHENLYSYFQMTASPRGSVESNLRDYEKVFPRTVNIHCHYFENSGDASSVLPLSAGDHLWNPLYNKIVESGYDGAIMIEVYKDYDLEKFAADLEYLRDLKNVPQSA